MNSTEKIKVMIVENIPQVVKHLSRLLSLIENAELASQLDTAQDAIEAIRESKPEVVMVDTSLPDMNGLKLLEIIRKEYPFTQVIIISQDKNYNTMLAAMRNGASDFLTHEVTMEELSTAIQRAGDLALAERTKGQPLARPGGATPEIDREGPRRQTGKIITVYSPKGGSGVTSLAINLGIALQDRETTVALVDSSVQFGDVPILLNELSKFSVLDLVPRVHALDAKMVEDVLLFHKSSGLHILTSPPRPEQAEQVTGNHLSQILEFMRQMFNYIVVDTSSYISDPCLAALDAGDVIVLVTSPEITAIRSARAFYELWDGLNMSSNRILLVLNRYNKLTHITPEKVNESLKRKVIEAIPEDNDTAFRAANYGIPILLNKRETPIGQSILSLAEKVREGIDQVEEEERVRLFVAA